MGSRQAVAQHTSRNPRFAPHIRAKYKSTGSFPIAHDPYPSVRRLLKCQFRSAALRNYFDTCGVSSKTVANGKAPALPERCTSRAKPHFRSFNLMVGNVEHQDAQVWSRARPMRPLVRQAPGRFPRHLARALASGVRSLKPGVMARHSPTRVGVVKKGSRGEFSSVQVGVCEGAKRGEVYSPATCEVLFGARRWARARAGGRRRRGARFAARRGVRRVGMGEVAAACRSTTRRRGDVFLGACRRWRRLGCLNSLQVHSPASWRCLPQRVSAWAKALWPVALSASGGLGRYWTAQWHLARAVGKRFRGAAQSASMFIYGSFKPIRYISRQ